MSALMMVLLAVSAGSAARAPLVFGDSSGWVVVSRDGRALERMSKVCGSEARELAVSADLKTYVFTAWSQAIENTLLYACEPGGMPRLLGESIGYHAQPSFSRDGQWVFFVHHPKKGGPPGMHDPGANAQLYRVRLDGSGLEAMTNSRGCKAAPQDAGDGVVMMLHLSCHGPRSIELLRLNEKSVVATAEDGQLSHWPDLTADGRHLLVTREGFETTQLLDVDLKTKQSRVLWTMPAGYENTRTAWGEGGKTVLFQREGAVWRVRLGSKPVEEKLFVTGGQS